MEEVKEKSKGQKLMDEIGYKTSNAWEKIGDKEKIFSYCEGYKNFLNIGKTERECAKEVIKQAEKLGYKNLDRIIKEKQTLKSGDKVYRNIRNKAVILAVIGKKPLEDGTRMIGAHIDAPRIDIKQNPLYENTDMAFFKTHYYGGIKKYQWLAIPLALHGVIIKKNGEAVEVAIGEDENDPVLTITDLLPHLAKDQMEKKLSEAISAEAMNALVGSMPYDDKEVKDKVKLNILNLLHEKYGITEEDFLTSELELVPAFKAKDVGLDRSMIGAYGQDDRVCAYTSVTALFDVNDPEFTAVCILTDKEEIGSVGNTGAESKILEDFIADLCYLTTDNYSDIILRRCLNNSVMLSADVNAAVDPNFEGTHDKFNAAYLGKGLAILKFSGSRGKAGASDAHAELLAKIRKVFNENGVVWHTSELGAVDKGGGGTIAMYIASLGVDVVDCGVPVLSMHAPFEVTSKADVYAAYLGYKAFYEKLD
ncbi:M18 family aminopeptidase 1 [Thermoclostridium stercorarium subsp. stercorarium DSM 8532]|uniref:M18 family aminopeptidase n=2 Tax=Thermoclostridium stercorarium TaxID=1510 RepID=L7VNQ9_THES1|nr:aminopeptidase [Thermoclostridium stercorarium]AGC68309.1 M18 family aminopeptidase 1 [Thermoclostridium stercorarium subsp. stercorarium DSM 8532]AGI39336.1 aspartyl aminopeptidase [Thermoclostridium stercorarium subsp. stercorarium DSM 8532]